MKCPTCEGEGFVSAKCVSSQCPDCEGSGIAPTPRVNCSGCGTPHPDHETALGMCVVCLGQDVVVLSHNRDQLALELNNLRKAIADPAAVWANMLRGTIARPAALDHYEELKAEVGRLTEQLGAVLESAARSTRVCNWREHQPGWAFCACQVMSRPIEMVVQFKFCPFCGGEIEVIVV